jgi:hypothetical protein
MRSDSEGLAEKRFLPSSKLMSARFYCFAVVQSPIISRGWCASISRRERTPISFFECTAGLPQSPAEWQGIHDCS